MDFKTTKMDRRFFMGALAVTAGAAAGGLPLSASAKSLFAPAPVAGGVPAVFLDIPFADTTGLHRAYAPPPMNFAANTHFEPHFYV